MTLSQRVRECRYAKGWGPDELAHRAEISRTALYQIESGKTELPRAGTLRRIAGALEVSIEDLLGTGPSSQSYARLPAPRASRQKLKNGAEHASSTRPDQAGSAMLPASVPVDGEARFAVEAQMISAPAAPDPPSYAREREREREREFELTVKLRQLLASPFGEGMARIIEEAYYLLVASRTFD